MTIRLMARKFNTAGPCIEGDHYMLDPLARIDVEEVLELIDDKRYFVLHAPRQTGKTTCLLALMKRLNEGGRYRALYANIEAAQAARGDVAAGMRTVVQSIAQKASALLVDDSLLDWVARHREDDPGSLLGGLLLHWARADLTRPAVLLLDEVDALVGDTLISLLRQIRAGYADRPAAFPQSIVLCGVRDVRDYRIHTPGQEVIAGGSPFNIKAESLRLGDLSRDECVALWMQHQAETGQVFDASIWPELWEDTRGQPWLVNALGHECTSKDRSARDRTVPITLERYRAARERLIQSRSTHLEQLGDKLREPRVHRVIAGLLEGDGALEQLSIDDVEYVQDLGLVRTRPQLEITNRIYREVIPRELTWAAQVRINPAHPQPWYVRPDRRLDVPRLLGAFQQFFREHSDAWIEGFSYKEAGPQLLMQAFLQRIVNGGGRISREYGLGRKRTDLLLEWPLDEAQGFNGAVQRVVIELKLLKKAPEATLQQGLEQTADYAANVGAQEAHLVLFDRRPGVGWDERIWQRTAAQGGWEIGVWGA
jgi:hypothetical protein